MLGFLPPNIFRNVSVRPRGRGLSGSMGSRSRRVTSSRSGNTGLGGGKCVFGRGLRSIGGGVELGGGGGSEGARRRRSRRGLEGLVDGFDDGFGGGSGVSSE